MQIDLKCGFDTFQYKLECFAVFRILKRIKNCYNLKYVICT